MATNCEPRVLRHVRSRRSDSFGSISSDLTRKSSRNELYSSNTSDPGDEEDQVTLFEGQTAVLSQFSAFSGFKDYENPPILTMRSSEQFISEGPLRVYKILGKSAGFLQCGKFIHPILPKLRFWRTDVYEFILPQPNPGKYWRLQLTNIDMQTFQMLNELEILLKELCFYMNIVEPEKIENDFVIKKNDSGRGSHSLDTSSESLLKEIPEPLYHDFTENNIGRVHSPNSFLSEKEEEKICMTKYTRKNDSKIENTVKQDTLEVATNFDSITLVSRDETSGIVNSISTDSSYSSTQDDLSVRVVMDNLPDSRDDYTYNLAMESISSSSTLDAILDSFDLPKTSVSEEPLIQDTEKICISYETKSANINDSSLPLDQVDEPSPIKESGLETTDFQQNNLASSFQHSGDSNLGRSRSTDNHHLFASDSNISPNDNDLSPSSFINSEKYSIEKKASIRRSLTTHPLVPLAQRTQIISSTYPLKYKSNDNRENIIDEPTLSSFPPPTLKRSISTGYFHTVTNDLFNPNSSNMIDKMDKMDRINTYSSLKGNIFNAWKPTDLRDRDGVVNMSNEAMDATLLPFNQDRINDRLDKTSIEPDFIQQAVVVSGYMGWRLFRKTLPGWVRR